MRFIDHSFSDPAHNLAIDEALLDMAEAGGGRESLRIWESPAPFAVLGVAQALHREVDEKQCADRGVPILRRCSAGGCVLQGPGCLNFSLVLDSERWPALKQIQGSYEAILGELVRVLNRHEIPAERAGISDLAVNGRKISGNAQRRKKRFILHHGTLLYAYDLEIMDACLREPNQRPDYRGGRTHGNFLASLSGPRKRLEGFIIDAFAPAGEPKPLTEEEIRKTRVLVENKYSRSSWTTRK